ncbi:MAG: DoxX family protein [Parcubacteria group bacterium]|nr:DoxX family protein [Parcubacteria group bacterium]
MLSGLTIYGDWGVFFLRFAVGVIFIVHGLPKIKKPVGIAQALGMPSFFGSIHGWVEVLGGIMMLIGLQERLVALVFSIIMLGAIYFKKFKWKVPFTAYDKLGWEFDLILLASNIMLLVS